MLNNVRQRREHLTKIGVCASSYAQIQDPDDTMPGGHFVQFADECVAVNARISVIGSMLWRVTQNTRITKQKKTKNELI